MKIFIDELKSMIIMWIFIKIHDLTNYAILSKLFNK